MRVIEQIRGKDDGPTLILVGGIHGNEPAGVKAAAAVLGRVRKAGLRVRGEVIALRGNVRGLQVARRYLAEDLNRMWTQDQIARARADDERASETAEVVELVGELERIFFRARGPLFAIDLHTTSAEGFPFGVIGGTPAHRWFAGCFPVSGIMGMEEKLEGVLTRYLSTRGCVTLAVEGGQHDSFTTAANLESVVTLALEASGVLGPSEVPDLETARAHLEKVRGALPRLIEVVSRHAITPQSEFRMEPGFANIHRTREGTLLARDKHGEIRAPFDGLVVLPLYQKQGSDGFFYARSIAE